MAIELAPNQLVEPCEGTAFAIFQQLRAFGAQAIEALARRQHADRQIGRQATGAGEGRQIALPEVILHLLAAKGAQPLQRGLLTGRIAIPDVCHGIIERHRRFRHG